MGERQRRHIPSLAKPAREFASDEAASETTKALAREIPPATQAIVVYSRLVPRVFS